MREEFEIEKEELLNRLDEIYVDSESRFKEAQLKIRLLEEEISKSKSEKQLLESKFNHFISNLNSEGLEESKIVQI